jgi:hypothetical protein
MSSTSEHPNNRTHPNGRRDVDSLKVVDTDEALTLDELRELKRLAQLSATTRTFFGIMMGIVGTIVAIAAIFNIPTVATWLSNHIK